MERFMRYLFTLLGSVIGYVLSLYITNERNIMHYFAGINRIYIFATLMVFTGLIFYFIYPIILSILRRFSNDISIRIRYKNSATLGLQLLGLVLGLILAFLLSSAFNNFPIPGFEWVISISIYFILGYLGWTIPSYHRIDTTSLLNRFKRSTETSDTSVEKQELKDDVKNNAKILDTSVIIDGRILDIYKTNFLEGTLIIPTYVLGELQLISDSSDDLKRNKGRRGLDLVAKLQKDYKDNIKILEEDYPDLKDVDTKLIKTAKDYNQKIITNDYNLNKVASLQGVEILNINDLANAVKTSVLPGEVIDVSLIKTGKEPGQAVAYLEDGTMIVVENGKHLIGKNLSVIVTSVLQTSAGRMIFAKPKGA